MIKMVSKVADLCPVGTVAWLLVVFVVVVSNSAEFDAWTDVMSGLVEFSVFFFSQHYWVLTSACQSLDIPCDLIDKISVCFSCFNLVSLNDLGCDRQQA